MFWLADCICALSEGAGLVGHMTTSASLTTEADPRKHTHTYTHEHYSRKSPIYEGKRSVAVWELLFALYWVELRIVCGVFGLLLSCLILWGNLGFFRREWERCARALTGLSLCEGQTGEFDGMKCRKTTPFSSLLYFLTLHCRLNETLMIK